VNDFTTYTLLQEQLKTLRIRHGAGALNLPEYQAAWRAAETVKNRHGGLPPKRPSVKKSHLP
jgi:hypothetical protein